MTPYRLSHVSALTAAQAAQLVTWAARGEALHFAPVKFGPVWLLLQLGTLTSAERAAFTHRVQLAAQFLDGGAQPRPLSA